MIFRKMVFVLVVSLGLLWPLVGSAQDGGDKPEVPEAPKADAEPDPADAIVTHIQAMTTIVKDNMDQPDTVLKEFKSYVDANTAAMKQAGERFESELNGMKADAAQEYQKKLQFKMEKPLEEFLTVMLEFSKLHPEKARELDEMLQAATMTMQ